LEFKSQQNPIKQGFLTDFSDKTDIFMNKKNKLLTILAKFKENTCKERISY